MLQVRKSNDRGQGDHGWLRSRHTFSFADYYDPSQMGFRSLRVINEDHIQGGTGFGMHPHRDMEIITYVVKGALRHQDSMGNKSVILPGEVQHMSAGTGVLHSEHAEGDSLGNEAHILQIWIQPKSRGGDPRYGQKSFEAELSQKNLVLVVSESGREGSIGIKQDADVYVSRLREGDGFEFELRPKRGAWIQLIKGRIRIDDNELSAGDGFSVDEPGLKNFKALENSEFILFDLV